MPLSRYALRLDESCLPLRFLKWSRNAEETACKIVFSHPCMAVIRPLLSPAIPDKNDSIGVNRAMPDRNHGMVSSIAVPRDRLDNVVRRRQVKLLGDASCE